MFTIEEYHQRLNQQLSNKYETWETYRQEIISWVIEELQDKESILVIGTGNANDIDLSFLEQHFEEITLTDIDIDSVVAGIQRQDVNPYRFRLKRVDWTHFEEIGVLEEFVSSMMACPNVLEMERKFDHWEKKLAQENHRDLDIDKVDFVWVSPIYTQLCTMQLLERIEVLRSLKKPEAFLEKLLERSLEFSSKVIAKFNEDLLDTCRENGIIFLVSDIFTASKSSAFYTDARDAMSDGEMDAFHRKYQELHGYGAGDFGYDHLKEYVKVLKETWLEWPFMQDEVYFVRLGLFEK